jgi:outer membrane immunogenic protein
MKRCTGVLAFTLTSVAALVSANAADLNVPPPASYYKAAPVVYPSWAGFYLGAHVGGAWSDLKLTDFDEDPGKSYNRASSVFGGGTAGYNFQTGNFVYGVELDVGAMSLSHSAIEPQAVGIDNITSNAGSGLYLDATARFGYAFDKALVYAKGGYAYYGGSVSIVDPGEASVKISGLNGWTVGGGLEYKIAPAWSVKAEYQFFDFGTDRLVMPSDHDRYDAGLTVHTVKGGVNYHF